MATARQGFPVTCVLLVIDLVNDFLDRWDLAPRDTLIASVNGLVTAFRSHDVPIVWVRQEFEPDLSDAYLEMRRTGVRVTIRGTPGCQLATGLDVRTTDGVIVKKRYSAFFGTDLDGYLRAAEASTLVLAGINTHACVRTTAIDAYQRDYDVVLASDCVGSYDSEHHAVSLRYMNGKIARVLTNREISSLLADRPAAKRPSP